MTNEVKNENTMKYDYDTVQKWQKSWAEIEIELACRRERADKDGKNGNDCSRTGLNEAYNNLIEGNDTQIDLELSREILSDLLDGNINDNHFDYGCACYQSALKAYNALMEGDHTITSLELTREVLNRLLNGKVLTPIEDTDDIWDDLEKYGDINEDFKSYQCRRMSSLFKYVYKDGTVKYKDVNRIRYGCMDGEKYESFVRSVTWELFPITMPYFPYDEPIWVFGDNFSTSEDCFYVRIGEALEPGKELIDIDKFYEVRFYEVSTNTYREITKKEFYDIKKNIRTVKLF